VFMGLVGGVWPSIRSAPPHRRQEPFPHSGCTNSAAPDLLSGESGYGSPALSGRARGTEPAIKGDAQPLGESTAYVPSMRVPVTPSLELTTPSVCTFLDSSPAGATPTSKVSGTAMFKRDQTLNSAPIGHFARFSRRAAKRKRKLRPSLLYNAVEDRIMADRKQFQNIPEPPPELTRLLSEARNRTVTEAELREQRVSFAFGNAPVSATDRITKASVRAASTSMRLL